MEQKVEHLENEINDLKQQLEHFQQEKEQVRAIIGRIGGVPKFRTKLINTLFIIIITASMVVSVVSGDRVRLLMIELALVALSLKIIYLMHCQGRVNHFKFWILSSIEWRINEVMTLVKQMKK